MTRTAYRDHVLSMSPEELRIEVAQRLGWKFEEVHYAALPSVSTRWIDVPAGRRAESGYYIVRCDPQRDWMADADIPDWPNDLAAAIELVQSLARSEWIALILHPSAGHPVSWTASWEHGGWHRVTDQESPALAICRAYLLATHQPQADEQGKGGEQ